MTRGDFNLETEYGDLLDLLEMHISEVDSVSHFGVKGMKWGVRRDQPPKSREPLKSLGPDSVTRKTASGETITLQKVPSTKLHEFLGRRSKNYRDDYAKQASLNILDGSGKKVGDAMVQKKNKDELYLEWLGIHKSARGKGYASAVMKAGRDFGKQEGFKRMVLEVPGNSPDARHIYEKLGFEYVGEVNGGAKDPIWGGLSEMVYDFEKVKHSSSDHLVHYGVKGMKWGVNRAENKQAKVVKRIERGSELVRIAETKGTKNPAKITALKGVGEVAGILIGGSVIANRIPGNTNAVNGAHIVKLLLAGKVGATRVGEVRAINAYNNSRRSG